MPLATGKESLGSYRHGRGGELRLDGGLSVPFERVRFERAGEGVCAEELSYSLTQGGRRLMEVKVSAGESVAVGDELARGEGLVLQSGCAGRVVAVSGSKRRAKGYVRIAVEGPLGEGAVMGDGGSKAEASVGVMRDWAARCGVWQEIQSGMTMGVADMGVDPKAIVVRAVFAEPGAVRGDLVIRDRLDEFIEGLEVLNRLGGGYASIILTITAPTSELGQAIRERLRGRAFVHTVVVPVRYPVENPLLLATLLGQEHGWGPGAFWMLDAQGVLALRDAFGGGAYWGSRLVAVSGPGVARPVLLEAALGVPLGELVKDYLGEGGLDGCCLLRGGIYSGVRARPDEGLDYGDRMVTVIPEREVSELFGWLSLKCDRYSWTKLFVSAFKKGYRERPKTLLQSDVRPCIGCGFCREVCPAGLYPHHLHRLVTHDCLEEAEELGLLNCVECHSCSYGCVSKLELSRDIVAARRAVLKLSGS